MQFNQYQFKPEIALSRYDGDHDLLQELVRIFIGELPSYTDNLKVQTELIFSKRQIDILPKLHSLCHKIRGSAFAIGLESLGNTAEKIEHHLGIDQAPSTALHAMIEELQNDLFLAATHLPIWLAEQQC